MEKGKGKRWIDMKRVLVIMNSFHYVVQARNDCSLERKDYVPNGGFVDWGGLGESLE